MPSRSRLVDVSEGGESEFGVIGGGGGGGAIMESPVRVREELPPRYDMIRRDTEERMQLAAEQARAIQAAARVRPDRLIVGAFAGAVAAEVVDVIGDGAADGFATSACRPCSVVG